MKKQFFYAALALSMIASCTSDDTLVVNPVEPTPEDSRVAIELGIDAPSVNAAVGSRGTGSVGDVATGDNTWNSQQLYITMIDRATGDVAVDENDKTILAWNGYTYVAPRKNEQAEAGKGNIRIYQSDSYNKEQYPDQGTIQYLYYPVSGKFDFYGWHLDDATSDDPAITATPSTTTEGSTTQSTTSIAVNNIVIDGTQDIMAAKTKKPNAEEGEDWSNVYNNWDDNLDLEEWLYSARSARSEIDPILKFEHKLARLKFFVRAGSETTALRNSDSGYEARTPIVDGSAPNTDYDHSSTGAMYITGLRAMGMINKFNMTLNNDETTTTAVDNAIDNFKLGDIATEGTNAGKIDTLISVAPEYPWNYTAKPADYKGTPVGESIMFLPEGTSANSIEFEIDMKQYLQLTEDETNADNNKYGYQKQEKAKFTVQAAHVVKSGSTSTSTIFKAGESYNVYITIYGFERIEVSAELTAWEDGGDVEVDIEEGNSSDNTGSTTTETRELTFTIEGIQAGETATVKLMNGENKTVTKEGDTNPTVKFVIFDNVEYTYTVEAENYAQASGTISSSAEDASETVTLQAATPAPTTKDVTINVEGLPEDGSVSYNIKVTKDSDSSTVDPKEGETNIFVLTEGEFYTITVTAENYTQQDNTSLEINAETNTITVRMQEETQN